jgi:NADH-dependant formate dehydrogenase delta subunit FdsD
MDVEKLVKMADQIAANLDYGADKEQVAVSVANHLKRSWTPSMLAAIIEGHRNKLIELSDIAGQAVDKLATQKNSAA